jgi:ATP-dependent exoDNAse (exonuclease V) beta subunit
VTDEGSGISERATSFVDDPARVRIRQELDTTMVVVAGAGTGKTTELVERIVQLVSTGAARLRDVAAITFTEAAAAELRERIRQALSEAATRAPKDPVLSSALEEVDDAAISTLHAFAQRILLEHCAAAGLPSGFEVLDDTADACDFEVRWERFADELFESPGAEPALVRGFVTGLRHTDLRAVARALHDNWDRLEENVDCDDEISARARVDWPRADPAPVIEGLAKALSLAGSCTDQQDKLLAHLRLVVADAREQLVAAGEDEEAVLHLLSNLPPLRCSYGRQENWNGVVNEVREACAAAESARSQILDAVRGAVLLELLPRLIKFVLNAADERRVEGRLTFHDLLVHARSLLRGGGDAVAALRRRYKWILVDEFQDTDPIQVELAARLASAAEGAGELRTSRPGGLFVVGDPKQSIYRFRRADIELFERVGSEIGERIVLQTNFRSVPGILEFVNVVFEELFGNQPVPGQARHHALHGARSALRASRGRGSGASTDANRTRDSSMRAGNDEAGSSPKLARRHLQLSFDQSSPDESPSDELTGEGIAPDTHGLSEPESSDVQGTKPVDFVSEAPATVLVLGKPFESSIGDVRRQAARDAAGCIRAMVEGAWQVDVDGRTTRAARFADVAMLIPTRTSLAYLEEAFEEEGVPYRLEGSSMLWDTGEVRDVLAVLSAADDPSDQLSVLGALRSPGLACGDDELVSWQGAGGRWDPRSPAPQGLAEHPVARAMGLIDALHRERWWLEPSALLARAIDDLRSFELALAHRRPRDHWQRLRWLCDQARLFDETAGGTLRAFLAWAQLQAEGDRGGTGVGPPDPDDDAVRIMTVHGSKGLEFPVVLLTGLERQESDGQRPQTVLWTDDGGLEIRAGPLFHTDGYEDAGRRDQELDSLERERLLYVGMTRARDHLVVCLHHRVATSASDSSLGSRIFEICESRPDLWGRMPPDLPASSPSAGGRRSARNEPGAGVAEKVSADAQEWAAVYEKWTAERAKLLSVMRRRPVTTASALVEAAARKSPLGTWARTDPGWPQESGSPWQDADVSLQVGRAVHGVLATVDLTTGRDRSGREAGELSRARAFAQGVGEHADSVASMVEGALSSSVVKRAASRRHWRELYVAVPVDLPQPANPAGARGVLEGFVDLLFEEDDGLVVVDYKTDRMTGPDTVRSASALYRAQVAAYSHALEMSCGKPVARCVLLFVSDGDPKQYVLEGRELAEARAGVLETMSVVLAG